MSSGIKGIVGALVIVILGLLLTPTVIRQVSGLSANQTCPTAAVASLHDDDETASAPSNLVGVDITVNVTDNPRNGFYRRGTLCATDGSFTAASTVTTEADAQKLAKATTASGVLAYDASGAKDIVNLVKILWVLGVLGGAVGFIYIQFRSSGAM